MASIVSGGDLPRSGRGPAILAAALAGGFLLRLVTWRETFLGGGVWIDGPDGYYHLRRAWLTARQWPWTPQTDGLVGAPEGGPISWPPLFDLLLATLALPLGGSPEAVARIGAWLPPFLGIAEIAILYWLVRRLFGAAAAGWAAACAAVLPGVVRYSLLGALDHDPLIESLALVALVGLAGCLGRDRARPADVGLVAVGLTLLLLTWVGAILHLGLVCALVVVVDWSRHRHRRESALAVALGGGALVAALASAPFVATSVWTERFGASFVGLSWLHSAALLATAAVGLGLAVWGRPTALRGALFASAAVGIAATAAVAWPAFRAGLTFFARGEPFLQGVMESQPLLSLFGLFDLRAPLVRLSLLVVAVPVLLPWTLRRARGDTRLLFLWTWLLYMLGLALMQSRYAHAAALAVAALAGVLASDAARLVAAPRRRLVTMVVIAVVLLPSLPAYLPVPGLESFRFVGRVPKIVTTGMHEVCDFLLATAGPAEAWDDYRARSSSSVLAPWSAGHWLIWRGRQGVVATPLGPQGQPAFVSGVRFYLESEPHEAQRLLERHRVRWVVTRAEIPPLEAYLDLAGVEHAALFSDSGGGGPVTLDASRYLATIAARLTWFGPDEIDLFGRRLPALVEFVEVFRGRGRRPNPFAAAVPGAPAEVPLVRVYEVRPAAPPDEDGQAPASRFAGARIEGTH